MIVILNRVQQRLLAGSSLRTTATAKTNNATALLSQQLYYSVLSHRKSNSRLTPRYTHKSTSIPNNLVTNNGQRAFLQTTATQLQNNSNNNREDVNNQQQASNFFTNNAPFTPDHWFLQPAPKPSAFLPRSTNPIAQLLIIPFFRYFALSMAENYVKNFFNREQPPMSMSLPQGMSGSYYPDEFIFGVSQIFKPVCQRVGEARERSTFTSTRTGGTTTNNSNANNNTIPQPEPPIFTDDFYTYLARWNTSFYKDTNQSYSINVVDVVDVRILQVHIRWGPLLPKTIKPQFIDETRLTKLYEYGPTHYLMKWFSLSWVFGKEDFTARDISSIQMGVEAAKKGAIVTVDVSLTADIEFNVYDHDSESGEKHIAFQETKRRDVVMSLKSNHFQVMDANANVETDENGQNPRVIIDPKWKVHDLQFILAKEELRREYEDRQRRKNSEEEESL